MSPTNYKSSEYVDDSDLEDIEEQVFEPPKHYHKLSHPSKSLPKAKDKEIWLIKTPKDFPLEKLKTLPIAFTKNRVAEPFDIVGSTYQVEEELSSTSASTIIPSTEINNKHTIFKAKHDSFRPTDLKISRFYNIKEVVNIPQIDFDKSRIPREDVPQLKRLRMRHFPTGYGEKDFKVTYDDDDSDVEEGKAVKRTRKEEPAFDEPHKEQHSSSKHQKKIKIRRRRRRRPRRRRRSRRRRKGRRRRKRRKGKRRVIKRGVCKLIEC